MAKAALKTVTTSSARWMAAITYRHDDRHEDVVMYLEELCDLHEVVEAGPHWDTISGINIVRVNHTDSSLLTVEQSEKL